MAISSPRRSCGLVAWPLYRAPRVAGGAVLSSPTARNRAERRKQQAGVSGQLLLMTRVNRSTQQHFQELPLQGRQQVSHHWCCAAIAVRRTVHEKSRMWGRLCSRSGVQCPCNSFCSTRNRKLSSHCSNTDARIITWCSSIDICTVSSNLQFCSALHLPCR